MKKLVIVALVLYTLWLVGGELLILYADGLHEDALKEVCHTFKGTWQDNSCYIPYLKQTLTALTKTITSVSI